VRRTFAVPGFGRLAVAYALNELAYFVAMLALSVLVYRRTGSVLGSAGFFLCSQGLPGLLAPMVVARLDRVSPRRLLPVLYWTEALLFGVLAWLTSRFLLAPVLALVVLDGTIALVARSLSAGARTELLKPLDLVREGGAVQSVMFSTAYLLGPVLAGLVAAAGGTVAALIVDCGLFALIGLTLVSRAVPDRIVHEGPESGRMRAALRYVRRDRPVATLLLLQTIAFVFFTVPAPLEVVYAVHTLHAGSTGYGVLLSVWGGGAVAGSLLYARWRRRGARWLIGLATLGIGLAYGIMAAAPDLGIALVGAVIAGLANGLSASAFVTELSVIVPQSWVALVTSFNQSLGQLTPGLGIAIGGVLAALASVRVAFGAAGAGCLALAAATALLLTPERLARPGPARAAFGVGEAEEAGEAGEAGGPGRPDGSAATAWTETVV
jgi:predicted MFS family arabinose efflux permease